MFKKIYVEITNKCNFKCSFCAKHSRKPENMSLKNFEKMIIQVKNLTDFICLHIMGEPLFHPEFSNILKVCDTQNVKINLVTNGFYLNKMFDEIVKSTSVKKISISLQSLFDKNNMKDDSAQNLLDVNNMKNNYEKIDQIFNNVKNYNGNKIFELRFWATNDEFVKNMFGELVAKHFNQFDKNFLSSNTLFTNSVKLKENIYLSKAEKFEWKSQKENQNVFCYGLKKQIGILSNGTVVPCCLDYDGEINLGNAFNEDINDILKKDIACKIIEGFNGRVAIMDRCKKCSFARRF